MNDRDKSCILFNIRAMSKIVSPKLQKYKNQCPITTLKRV